MSGTRPDAGEYAEYYGRYVGLVPDGDILKTLARQGEETRLLLAEISEERETFRYAPGKWSLREVVGHCLDTERVFAFRGLWIARGAAGEQPGMEQDDWTAASHAADRPLVDLAEEWATVRIATIQLFRSVPAEDWDRRGMASGCEFTVRAFPWIIAGHELYHRSLLRRDYLEAGS